MERVNDQKIERVIDDQKIELEEKSCKNKACKSKWLGMKKTKSKYCSQICSGEVDAFTAQPPPKAFESGFVKRLSSIDDVEDL